MGNKETGDGENWEIEKIDKTREMEKGELGNRENREMGK